jgi:hypothetical protein
MKTAINSSSQQQSSIDESSAEYFKAMEVAKLKEEERRKKLHPPLLSVKYKRSAESRSVKDTPKILPRLDHEPVYPFKSELVDFLTTPSATSLTSPSVKIPSTAASIAVSKNLNTTTTTIERSQPLSAKGRAPPKSEPSAAALASVTAPSSGTGSRPALVSTYQPVLAETAKKAEIVSKNLESSIFELIKSKDDMKISELEHDEFMFFWKSSLIDDIGLDVDKGKQLYIFYGKQFTYRISSYLRVITFCFRLWYAQTANESTRTYIFSHGCPEMSCSRHCLEKVYSRYE